MTLRRSLFSAGALALSLSVALVGCSTDPDGDAGADSNVVTISGNFTGEQSTAFQNDLDAWAADKGITVQYSGSANFSTTIVTEVKGGQAPDIILSSSPGILKGLISEGMIPLDDMIDVSAITADQTAGLPEIAMVDGKTYGLPYNINIKSVIFYNPAAFEAAGYTVPTTDDELMALQNQIIADESGYPWCVGLASQGSNGWPMTDWFEEYVIKYGGLEEYNKWISGELKFDSPLVRQAAEKIESLLFVDGAVNGGNTAMAATDFGTAGNSLFVTTGKADGQCFMMRQGTQLSGFFPAEIQAEIAAGDTTNVSIFPVPSPDGGAVKGVVGGGDIAGAFTNDDATKQVIEYLVGPDFGKNGYNEQWPAALSPHSNFPADQYYSPFTPIAQAAIAEADAFGFDASDQMPGAVGGGGAAAMTHMMQWVSGQETLDEMLAGIDEAFPAQ